MFVTFSPIQGFKLGMTGEGYAWLILGWYAVGWHLDPDEDIDCTQDEMKQAVEGASYIGIESLHIGISKDPLISNIVSKLFN